VILATPLADLDWLPPQRARQLERFGLVTVGDLLTHFPRRHEDRTQFDRFPTGDSDRPVCVCGLVKKTSLRRIRGSQKMFDVVLEEEQPHALSQPLMCRWFNAHWVEKAIVHGQRLVVYGRPKRTGSAVVIAHPEFEVVEEDAEVSIHLRRIVPVHRATEGLSPRVLRRIVWDVLEQLQDDTVETLLPASLDATPRAWALRQMHFPDSAETLARARRHLVLEEFFAMQLAIAARRAEQTALPGAAHCGPGELMARLHSALPFPLTGAQLRAIGEIRADLAAPRAMNRLLHGDVGSGKTLVALSAMLLCVESGHQAALMAPTQILAEQHYLTLRRWCEPLGLRVSLRTGARTEDAEPLPLFAQAEAGAGSATGPGSAPVPGAGGLGTTRVPRVGEGVPPSRTSDTAPTSPGARYSKRNLPHFEYPHAIYAVTVGTRGHRILSATSRTSVLEALRHFHGSRYDLIAACVMPDHFHFLLQPRVKEPDAEGKPIFWPLAEILHSIKSFTAHKINDLERTTGAVWEQERFDRYIRSDRDLEEKFEYIVRNPWDAGVVRPDEAYAWIWTADDEFRDANAAGSASSRDATTNTRDACGTRNSPPATIPDSEPHLLVGTHALLYEGAGFTRLGLAVIDEQHKFGVRQRARLREQGAVPDVLVMTATPIPRTLTMTLYGDLDVSTLDELPAGRSRIATGVRAAEKLPEAVKFIREQLESGRQAYVVYPLIDESEKLEAKAAATEFAKWEKLLAPLPCALLHGRIPAEEKDAIMEEFRRGETKALIATTVIEVGIDVPNATVMLIENAERFGLAQLHQLRGRIGRGAHKSYCVLLTGPKADEAALEKLHVLEETGDGFQIAEADLRLRGPGDILGTAQSGLPPLKLGDVLAEQDLMRLARNAAFLVFERDPHLEQPAHRPLRQLLDGLDHARFSVVS
jgi:RecG-like helicase/REP element-mobilizing transposase RayT